MIVPKLVTHLGINTVHTASSLLLNSELGSSYKNHAPLKCLVGITPGGPFSFVSQLYTGHISDRKIVMRSGFLDQQFNNGDSVMADKGFTIDYLLQPRVGFKNTAFSWFTSSYGCRRCRKNSKYCFFESAHRKSNK